MPVENNPKGSDKSIAEPTHSTKNKLTQGSWQSENLEQFPTGWVWETDSDGIILWCSSEVHILLGYHPEELVGRNLVTIANSPRSTSELQRALASGKPIFNLKIDSRSNVGKSATLLVNAILRGTEKLPHIGYRGVSQVLTLAESPEERVKVQPPQIEEVSFIVPTAPVIPEQLVIATTYFVQNGQVQSIMLHEIPEIPTQPEISNGRLTVPILGQQDTILGVVEFERDPDEPPWTEEDKELVASVSHQLALAIQDVQSYQLAQQTLDEMRSADQLKTEFLANLSQELRTPLNAILEFSQMTSKGLSGIDGETQKQNLDAISNSGKQLLSVINNILDFSLIESGKMELSFADVDLKEIIASVTDPISSLIAGRPIKLIYDIPSTLPKVWGDSTRLQQVFMNLLSNAAKFTKEGQIGISARVSKDAGERVITLSVFDSGPGITPEEQKKIFEPFSQIDSSLTRVDSGTGLGLLICRHLVESHGGQIWVESTPGKGSTFFFTLPISKTALLPEALGVTPLFLVAYTQDRDISLESALVQEAGFPFIALADLSEIVPKAIELQPQIILIDPAIPDGLGWKLISEIKRNPEVRTIPTKMFSILEDNEKGFDLGIGEIATKPLLRECLESSIDFLVPERIGELSILIIDDKQESLEWIRNLVQLSISKNVRTAASGFEGLVATRQQIPDLIILNLFMSGADGFRMVEALRIDERTRNTPVILLFPQTLSTAQIQQLQLWTNHCRERVTLSTRSFFQELFNRLQKLIQRRNGST